MKKLILFFCILFCFFSCSDIETDVYRVQSDVTTNQTVITPTTNKLNIINNLELKTLDIVSEDKIFDIRFSDNYLIRYVNNNHYQLRYYDYQQINFSVICFQ